MKAGLSRFKKREKAAASDPLQSQSASEQLGGAQSNQYSADAETEQNNHATTTLNDNDNESEAQVQQAPASPLSHLSISGHDEYAMFDNNSVTTAGAGENNFNNFETMNDYGYDDPHDIESEDNNLHGDALVQDINDVRIEDSSTEVDPETERKLQGVQSNDENRNQNFSFLNRRRKEKELAASAESLKQVIPEANPANRHECEHEREHVHEHEVEMENIIAAPSIPGDKENNHDQQIFLEIEPETGLYSDPNGSLTNEINAVPDRTLVPARLMDDATDDVPNGMDSNAIMDMSMDMNVDRNADMDPPLQSDTAIHILRETAHPGKGRDSVHPRTIAGNEENVSVNTSADKSILAPSAENATKSIETAVTIPHPIHPNSTNPDINNGNREIDFSKSNPRSALIQDSVGASPIENGVAVPSQGSVRTEVRADASSLPPPIDPRALIGARSRRNGNALIQDSIGASPSEKGVVVPSQGSVRTEDVADASSFPPPTNPPAVIGSRSGRSGNALIQDRIGTHASEKGAAVPSQGSIRTEDVADASSFPPPINPRTVIGSRSGRSGNALIQDSIGASPSEKGAVVSFQGSIRTEDVADASSFPPSVNPRAVIGPRNGRSGNANLNISKNIPPFRKNQTSTKFVAPRPKILAKRSAIPISDETSVLQPREISKGGNPERRNSANVSSRSTSSMPKTIRPTIGASKYTNGVKAVQDVARQPRKAPVLIQAKTPPNRNVQTANGETRVLPTQGARGGNNKVSVPVMTASCAAAHNASMIPVTPSPPPPMGRSRVSNYQGATNSIQNENQQRRSSSMQISRSVTNSGGNVQHPVALKNAGNITSSRTVPPVLYSKSGNGVQGLNKENNFDDVLSSFTANLTESGDVWNRSDADMVDLNVKLCVSHNVALRLHGSFDDLLEDVENILKDC